MGAVSKVAQFWRGGFGKILCHHESHPAHFAEVKSRKEAMLDKTAKAVKDRMTR
jgi:Holliday junction resolvase-like predicted endonuclease